MLEVERWQDVHRVCCHGASYGIELADEGVEEPERERAAPVERQRRVDLAAEIADLRAWDPELHASSVHQQAEEHDLVRVDTEAEGVQRIDRDLSVANRLGLVAHHQNDVADVHDRADAEPTQVPNCHLQKLGRNFGCLGEAEGHRHALVLRTVEHEAEESVVGRCI